MAPQFVKTKDKSADYKIFNGKIGRGQAPLGPVEDPSLTKWRTRIYVSVDTFI